ncbi:uncharacterized protein K460DRAFT_407470 [Cucurbitaria berberidis CBS 394.84]|uniref:Uncharacterized protein n=1 Tax=Cucurbitaria berberidis CBS 394.84 TaxID=1168544 RepID=A0A9P4GCX5_9PLEO|nr:uncharacterized protein K460DRAFT_407470 [Cucurbitaria berberidis CBS 394.84]KAF1843102.1 hypothetical protein K460DRAFT_407470 [Cucurbitaria berberidis CBS 394.84]
MATHHSPSKTPSRRVLGDLTPKSINTPLSQTKGFEPSEVTRAQSPRKHATTHAPTALAGKENLATLSEYSRGTKRGIQEVDGAETAENLKMLARGRDETLSHIGMRLTSAAMMRHTENNPIGLADPGSPTERNTPTPEPEPMQDSQRSNQSFSDLLNYDLCASQKSEQGVPAEAAVLTAMPMAVLAPSSNEERKSRAEQLRTRLKFGLYKVKTNQISKRDVDIISTFEASTSHSSGALNASRSTVMNESIGSHQVPNITISSPRREQGPVFVKANLDPFRPIGKLGAAPIQFLPPQDGMSASSRTIYGQDFSSSPPGAILPQSVSPAQLMSPVRRNAHYGTPTVSRIRMGEHDGEDIEARDMTPHQRLQRLKEQNYLEGDLTSSAVKGNAAKGLLQLMNGRR